MVCGLQWIFDFLEGADKSLYYPYYLKNSIQLISSQSIIYA